MLSDTASAESRFRARSPAKLSAPSRDAGQPTVQPHPVPGERPQVDVVPAVPAGHVMVGPEPHRVGVVELGDRPAVVTHVIQPGHHVPAAVPPGDPRRAAHRQVNAAARQVQVLGDLAAGLPGTDDEHVTVGELPRAL